MELNTQQKNAIEFGAGPLLVIAGAGTGKTTVITERIKHLIFVKKIPPQHIAALTFTEKAAKEMQDRIDIALPYGYADMWIHTFHGFCDRILRTHSLHIGLSSNYKLFNETESIVFLRNNLFSLELDYFRPLGNPDKFLQGLLQHFSRLQDEDVTPAEYDAFAKRLQRSKSPDITEDYKKQIMELSRAFATYQLLKAKNNIMDFSDLISNTLRLFRERKHILQQYQKELQYILVDEFQDTNFAQNQLAILLAGNKQNITVVGDDDQAIYRWRGAALSNMMQFKQNFPHAKIISLTQNYRSTQTILDTAYTVIQNNNPDRLEVKEKINKRLISTQKNKKSHPIGFIYQQTGDQEAECVAQKIKQLHEEGNSFKDIAIVIRANDNAQPFIHSLERLNIPHQFLGPGKLFHQEEVKDLIAYLKFLYNPEDNQSLYRILSLEVFHIPPIDISRLLSISKKESKSLADVIQQPPLFLSKEGDEGIKKLSQIIAKHIVLIPKESAGKILYDFVEQSGILLSFLQHYTQDSDIKAQNIAKFFERLKQFENHAESSSVYAAVDWLDLAMQLGESPLAAEIDWSENDAVNILTIHASKGLEFPIVFIVNLVTQRFPSRSKSEQIPIPDQLIKEQLPTKEYHIEEERRLFYVALTRAKERIFLTAAKNYGEGKSERKLSPFVVECFGENILQTPVGNISSAATSFSFEKLKIPPQKPLKITYLSYSQIQTFDICPLHYKLKYLLKIPTLQAAALSFGTSIHAALKEFYSRVMEGEKVDSSDIPAILESVWIREGYSGKEHHEKAFAGAINILTSYIHSTPLTTQSPIALEYPFQFPLGQLKIGGRMDRIDSRNDGSVDIIDYKTGRSSIDEKSIKNNLQLAIYALAAQHIPLIASQKTFPQIQISLHYLELDKKITGTISQEDLAKAREKLLQKAKEIEESDFTCSKSIFCKNCEYNMLCQAQM